VSLIQQKHYNLLVFYSGLSTTLKSTWGRESSVGLSTHYRL